MKITSSLVAMRSQFSHTRVTQEQEHLRVRVRRPSTQATPPAAPRTTGHQAAGADAVSQATETDVPPLEQFKLGLIKSLLERLTGIEIKLFSYADLKAKLQAAQDVPQPPPASRPEHPRHSADFAMAYDYQYTHIERQSTRVSMSARVTTSDGKVLNIGVQLNLSRQLVQHQELHLRAGDPKLMDPLVLNFQGNSAQLSQRQFSFDLNADGHTERLASLLPGSGFLALDKNGDGRVNNGTELFGAMSGNGFAELAKYDQDGNHFIDEADAAFQQLRVWTRDAEGHDRLLALGQADVGAIYLGHVASPFDLQGEEQQLLGRLRDSGFFLKQNGEAGTVQQIDLMV